MRSIRWALIATVDAGAVLSAVGHLWRSFVSHQAVSPPPRPTRSRTQGQAIAIVPDTGVPARQARFATKSGAGRFAPGRYSTPASRDRYLRRAARRPLMLRQTETIELQQQPAACCQRSGQRQLFDAVRWSGTGIAGLTPTKSGPRGIDLPRKAGDLSGQYKAAFRDDF